MSLRGQPNTLPASSGKQVEHGETEVTEVPDGLIDTRELAFWMVVDKEGVADAHANLVGYRQAAEWMRAFADKFDAKADAEERA